MTYKDIDWNDYDISEEVGADNYNFNNKNKMNKSTAWHNIVMWFGFVVAFGTGVISAYKGGLTVPDMLVMVSSGLLAVEHSLRGNV